MLAAFAVKGALVDLLTRAAEGRYRVEDIRKRKTDAGDLLERPLVTVYFDSGNFPKNRSGSRGPYTQEATIRIDILTAAKTTVDLSVLQNPEAAPEQITAALAATMDAYAIVDAKAEETAAILFDLIMRPQNSKLGTDNELDRWITSYNKGRPQPTGSIVILAGYFTMTFDTVEYTSEETGTPGSVISHRIDLTSDTENAPKEGVTVGKPF